MDYKDKYEKALKRCIKLYNEAKANEYTSDMEDYETIFPELKESEDEKIRNALIRFHKSTIDVDGIKGEEIIAWLEKQGKSSDQIHYWTEEEIEPIINDYLRGAEHYGGMIGRLRCLKPKSLEKQGKVPVTINIDKMVRNYANNKERGNEEFGKPVNCMIRAYRQGIVDALEKQSSSYGKWQKNTPDNKPTIRHSVLMKTTQGIAEGEWQGEYWFQYRWSWTLKDSDVLAWMELSDLDEQGEQKPFDYEHATITQKDFASVGETATIELSSPIDCGDRIYHVSHKPIEKNGEQKSILDFKANNWHVSKVDGKIHDMTYNSTDRAEPKFKDGDYIIHNEVDIICKIISVNSGSYYVENIETNCRIELSYAEQNFHLWTIQDAKDGDVLAGNKGDVILMFRRIGNAEWNDVIDYHCYYDCYRKDFIVQKDVQYWGDTNNNQLKPATKEQCDLLFQKMKEAGYEWNAEKKELKKIEQKPTEWSDEDENYLQSAENACEYQYGKNTSTILWLKSLKERITWKPSEEQMEIFKELVDDNSQRSFYPTLKSLYNDLKKL